MKNLYRIFFRLTILSLLAASPVTIKTVRAQIIDKSIPDILKQADRSDFRQIPKKPGQYTKEEWRAIIDSTWGPGMSTAKKLQLFDYCWNYLDATYSSFFHIPDKWDSLYDVYRPEVAAGGWPGRDLPAASGRRQPRPLLRYYEQDVLQSYGCTFTGL